MKKVFDKLHEVELAYQEAASWFVIVAFTRYWREMSLLLIVAGLLDVLGH